MAESFVLFGTGFAAEAPLEKSWSVYGSRFSGFGDA